MSEKIVRKTRSILLSDSEYDICLHVAGHRQFSAWARDVVILAATSTAVVRYGTSPGGLCYEEKCGHSSGAWWYQKNQKVYECEACMKACSLPQTTKDWLYEDRNPSKKLDFRDRLIADVVRASAALADFDRLTGGGLSSTAVTGVPAPVPSHPSLAETLAEATEEG